MTIKCLIVDDQRFAHDYFIDLLENHPELELIGHAYNGAEALDKIRLLQPELVFLDVEMPDMNGFEVLAQLENINFQTIFITAHSHYAIDAIRFNALDYLVKPIKPKEFGHALKRYQSSIHSRFNQDQILQALENLKKENQQDQVLFLPTQEGGLKLPLHQIIMLESDRNYSTIYLSNGKTKLSSKTLGFFEEVLEGKGFFRCHRSFILNRSYVNDLKEEGFILSDEQLIPVSRRRKRESREWFEQSGS